MGVHDIFQTYSLLSSAHSSSSWSKVYFDYNFIEAQIGRTSSGMALKQALRYQMMSLTIITGVISK